MMSEKVLSRSVRLMFAGGMALGASVTHAQDNNAAPASTMQRVEVTGSRIPSLNTEGASPVTTLSAKDIKIDGVRNTEDLLNNLPQVFASQEPPSRTAPAARPPSTCAAWVPSAPWSWSTASACRPAACSASQPT
jgi:outer membrane receptor protein involved in Fe transport